jgi:hypothetical protein
MLNGNMNNTKNLLLIAIIATTLVMGTSVVPMQSYADRDNDDHKKDNDFKSKIIASYESDKKSASQEMDQDNFCYRGDDCEQANQGQQLVGKDNEAKGFNDQSDNLALSSNGAGTGTGNRTTPTPTPTPKTCVECFTTAFAGLTQQQIKTVVEALGGSGSSIQSLCNLESIDGPILTTSLLSVGVSQATITALIDCLLSAGVTITGSRG